MVEPLQRLAERCAEQRDIAGDKQHPDGNLDDGILHSEPPFLFGSFGYPSYPLLYKFFSGL